MNKLLDSESFTGWLNECQGMRGKRGISGCKNDVLATTISEWKDFKQI